MALLINVNQLVCENSFPHQLAKRAFVLSIKKLNASPLEIGLQKEFPNIDSCGYIQS